MYVAVSSRAFPDLVLSESLQKLADLEYHSVEIVVGSGCSDLDPVSISEDFERTVRLCLSRRSIRPVAFFFDLPADDADYFAKFEACCRLAKYIKVIVITVRSGILGTPYNEEIERLRYLASVGLREGVVVGVLTEAERISESPDAIRSLCKSVPGLAVTLDPSSFLFGRPKAVDYDAIIPLVCHVRLRDTTPDRFHVQIGQGVLEYNKLVIQLVKNRYRGSLCVDIAPLPDVDTEGELRKMRLLLESLL